MQLFWSVTAAVLAVGIVGGAIVHRRWRDRPATERWLGTLAPLALGAALQILVGFGAEVTGKDWSSARLAQSLAILKGYELYSPADSGPLLSTLYGPVSVLLFVPAVLTGEVTSALFSAVFLNMAYMLGPLVYFFLRASGRERRGLALAAFPFVLVTIVVVQATQQMVGAIHVDGPAVGLGLLSCAFLIGRERPGRGALGLAATCAVLAAWTKQVEAPMVLGQLVWLGLRHGRRTTLAYFVALAVSGAVVSAAFVLAFGFEDMFLNILVVPGTHGFYDIPPIAGEVLLAHSPFALLILLVAFAAGRDGLVDPARRSVWRAFAADWGLPALVCVALLPTSILARAKHGGFYGSIHSQFYVIVSATTALVWLAGSGTERAARLGRRVALGAALFVSACTFYQPYRPNPMAPPYMRCPRGYGELVAPGANRQRQVYDFAAAHPDEAYFPWNPLSTLFADGKLYHFEWAVFDRRKAGLDPTKEHIRAELPAELKYVFYPRNIVEDRAPPKMILMPYLAEFRRKVDIEGMPDWVAFTKPERKKRPGRGKASPAGG